MKEAYDQDTTSWFHFYTSNISIGRLMITTEQNSKHNEALTCTGLSSPQAGVFANTYLRTSKQLEHPQTVKTAKVQVLNVSTLKEYEGITLGRAITDFICE